MSHYYAYSGTGPDTMQARRGHTVYPAFVNPQQAGHHDSLQPHSASQTDAGLNAVVNQFTNMSLASGPYTQAPGTVPNLTADSSFMHGNNAHFVYAPYPQMMTGAAGPEHAYGPGANWQYAAYMPAPGNYPAGAYPGLVSYTPARTPREVPSLETTRRGSRSTSATESPATPFFGNVPDRLGGTRVAAHDRSTYTTPSPQQNAPGSCEPAPDKTLEIPDPELDALLLQYPAIPRAVPAVFTPPEHMKNLDQCLENRITGNKNVYIRGLHPTTDDEVLLKYAARFGEVEQSKAIIDTSTGACKGFGFAKFKDVNDSEKCIRGFYRLGYEVGFARESFNARLKAEGDEGSTNLYISNLPKDLNETELVAIFQPIAILSSKILRDSMGNSRGVGFARFESRDICEQVIKDFNNKPVGKQGLLMQIRYADTPAQKELKRVTAERRQYRTNEYNIGAYGTSALGMHPTIYNPPAWTRRSSSVPYKNGSDDVPRSSEQINGPSSVNAAVQISSSEDASGDEGAGTGDHPDVANGSSQSSPTIKKVSV